MKYRCRGLVRLARALVPDADAAYSAVGARRHPGAAARPAYAAPRDDFCLEGDDRSMHVLNAVSPAFTCSLPFADHVVERIAQLRGAPKGVSPDSQALVHG